MIEEAVSAKILKALGFESNTSEPWSDDTTAFCREYARGYDTLPEEVRPLAFKNVIRKSGTCGFASGGSNDYLVNTDSGTRYRVTVRTNWTQGISSGQFDSSHVSEAGGQLYLGCTDSGAIPVAYYSRRVVGEVAI